MRIKKHKKVVNKCLNCGKECKTDFCSKKCAREWSRTLEMGYKEQNNSIPEEVWTDDPQS